VARACPVVHPTPMAGGGQFGEQQWLDDEEPRTLMELSSMFGLTSERVRQIEHGSLDKLRALIKAVS
jgi:DNA-directed RNA polymerase sigma subunit (sigma70/sigma32)